MQSHRKFIAAVGLTGVAAVAGVATALLYLNDTSDRDEHVSRIGTIQVAPDGRTDLVKVIKDACLYQTSSEAVVLTLDPECPADEREQASGTFMLSIQAESDEIVLTGTNL